MSVSAIISAHDAADLHLVDHCERREVGVEDLSSWEKKIEAETTGAVAASTSGQHDGTAVRYAVSELD